MRVDGGAGAVDPGLPVGPGGQGHGGGQGLGEGARVGGARQGRADEQGVDQPGQAARISGLRRAVR